MNTVETFYSQCICGSLFLVLLPFLLNNWENYLVCPLTFGVFRQPRVSRTLYLRISAGHFLCYMAHRIHSKKKIKKCAAKFFLLTPRP